MAKVQKSLLLIHLSGMGKNLFGQRYPDNRGSTVLQK